MNATVTEDAPEPFALFGALLLYRGARGVLARQHEVIVERGAAPRLGAGTLVTGTLIDELLALADRRPLTYVPPNVVALSRQAVAWYEPAVSRPMYFRPQDDPALAAFDGQTIPQPPLVFIARPHALDVFALGDDVRPTLATPLALAPYWNIFDSRGGCGGRVCLGSMVLPEAIDAASVGAWSAAFFNSNFTHLSSGKRWARAGTYAELLAAAVAARRFDPAWLLPAKATLAEALCTS